MVAHDATTIKSTLNHSYMKSYFKSIIVAFGTLALLTTVSSCGDKADFLQSLSPASGARVKFYHAAADAPAVDILVNDVK